MLLGTLLIRVMKGTSQGKYTKKDELWIEHLSDGDTYIQERTVLVGSSLAFTFLDLAVTWNPVITFKND